MISPPPGAPEDVPLPEGIRKVSVRVPPFWKQSPDLWFLQLEAQFHTSGISQDETKYYTLVGNLDANILTEVRDVVRKPPKAEMYNTLKAQLLLAYQESEQRRLQKLLSQVSLDGRRPTQLLNQMKELASDGITPEVLRTLWLQRLPQQIQAILAVNTGQDITQLASMADKISEALSSSDVLSVSSTSVAELQQQIAALKTEIGQLRRRSSSRQRNSSRHNDKSHSPAAARKASTKQSFCWYHRRFGRAAKRCQQPCEYQGN